MTRDIEPSATVNAPSVTGGVAAPSVLRALRCSVCGAEFAEAGRALRCAHGHSFDIAKQGYVNLLHAKVPAGTADTPAMVAARAAFLDAGHYAPLADAVARAAEASARVPRSGGASPDFQRHEFRDLAALPELVLDAGAGTGYYLAAALDALPNAAGLALDLSAAACRRAARAHPRAAAAVWNTWEPLPLADGCASVMLNVFAPRNAAEFRRVLRDDGVLVVVTPTSSHLAELGELTLAVDPRKDERLTEGLSRHFDRVDAEEVNYPLELSASETRTLIEMGPTAHHLSPGALDALPDAVRVTVSCTVAVYRLRDEAA
ncbi:putative RNA methyltransferase [Haloechinothrix halophila]|uniref:putative RNA methyltransferase n=1 Tax=Haloechinothrix halophila TaxID=1069073 RepID=UPI001E5A69D7|nr:methyltransferase domain-containing protein [Haloechinothrix halophila]